jgi:hypothetical protein
MTSVSARTGPESPGEHGMVTSITVPLSADVADDLRRLQERTRLSVADLTNRAITSYEFLEACLHVGLDLIVRDARTGETGRVQFS